MKYSFNENWDPAKNKYKENIIGLNKTIIKYQILYFLKETYGKNLTEMTNTKNSEGLSGSDKMEMNMSKLDIGIVDLAKINVETSIAQLMEDIDLYIPEEEIAYYREHHNPSDIQVHLVRSIFAGMFTSYRDENLINRYQYNKLILILKKKLLLDNGYNQDDVGEDCYLPYILTGNLEGKANHKPIREQKLVAELEEDENYQYLINVKYKELEEMKPGTIKEIIATFVNSEFTYVCWENQDLLGQVIKAPERKLISELLWFLKAV